PEAIMTPVRITVRALSAVLLAVVAVAPAAAQNPATVKMAVVPSIPSASSFLAFDKGYFRAAGLDVTIERIDSLSKAVAFLSTNQVQVGQGGISAGFFSAVAEGLPLTIALESGSTPLYHRILLRTELKDVIKTPADLKGRRVGVASPGSAAVYEIGMVLDSVGLKLKDVDIKYLSYTQMGAALANGALDAALQVAPFIDIAIEQKMAVGWIDPEDHIKQLPLTNVFYIANVDWIRREADVARRFFMALARAGRDYCQAYHRGPNRGELIDVMIANKVVNDRDLLDRMDWQARSPNGSVSLDSVASMQAFYQQERIIDREVPGSRLIDPRFAEAAAKELGAFELLNKSSTLKGCR